MKVQVKKWGNSASVRIPSAIMAAAALHIDQHVNVREEGGRVVIEPIAAPAFDLDTLLDRVTPENLHEPVDLGAPMGNELW